MTEKIKSNIKIKKYKAAEESVDEVYEAFIKDNFTIEDVVYMWNQLITFLKDYSVDKFSINNDNFMDYDQMLNSFGSFKELCLYLKETAEYIISEDNITCKNINLNKNFLQLIDYIDKNFPYDLQLKDLADQFFLNYSYCCELFKKAKGCTFIEYITSLRMGKARELLKKRELSVNDVAEMVGYKDYFYFNRCFKKFHGITPLNFKKTVV